MNDADEEDKLLTSPIATGGGGTLFEYNVQSLFVVLMLTGGIAPALPPWPIVEIQLQTRYRGFETDDFIASAADPKSGRRARLLGQIKRDITVTASDTKFGEVIKAMWKDYKSSAFEADLDRFALITGPLSSNDCSGVRALLHIARTCASSTEFFTKVGLSGFISNRQREKLNVLREHLKAANEGTDVTEEELWQFLKVFNLIGYDLEFPDGSSSALLTSLVMPYGHSNVEGLLMTIKEAVAWHDQAAGTISPETIPGRIKEMFEKPPGERTIPEEYTQSHGEASALDLSDDSVGETLKVAVLLGSWNENVQGDKEIIDALIEAK